MIILCFFFFKKKGQWENHNISIPRTVNKTEIEEARSNFKFDGPGLFSINLKAMSTNNEDINYIEVIFCCCYCYCICVEVTIIGIHSNKRSREK